MAFVFRLDSVLEELGMTRNALAVEAKVRPATLADLHEGKTKRVELPTFAKILDVLNAVAKEKGIDKTYTINSIIEYKYEESGL